MANSLTIIPSTMDAQATQRPFETNGYSFVVVSASNLAGAEEADIFIESGGAFVPLPDAALTGTAKLTATITALELLAGPRYAVTKDATVGACSVSVTFGTVP